MEKFDIFIVGGGAAGMSAAIFASRKGARVLIAEQENSLGGTLNQCIHKGFGISIFNEELTGTEYARHFISLINESSAEIMTGTRVLSLFDDKTALLSNKSGIRKIAFDKCILASGCTEKTIYSLKVSGTRPEGIFTAGQAQRLINIDHIDIGDDIIILGSGDIGQIMARRLKILSKNIIGIIEKKPSLGGLPKNRRNCIEAYSIPVILDSTIDEISGSKRINGVWVKNLKTGKRSFIPCSTLITSLGLIPDRSLTDSLTDKAPHWLYLCGNCDYVHDIVDTINIQAEKLINSILK